MTYLKERRKGQGGKEWEGRKKWEKEEDGGGKNKTHMEISCVLRSLNGEKTGVSTKKNKCVLVCKNKYQALTHDLVFL